MVSSLEMVASSVSTRESLIVSDIGAALAIAIGRVAMNIDDDVKSRARTKLGEWFPDYDQKKIEDVE